MTDPVPARATPLRQVAFDPLGPTVRQCSLPGGRTARYVDEGDDTWPAFLFLGGAGTTVRALGLLEFARTLREELGLRAVSVERNGLGQSPYDPRIGPAQHARDVWQVMDRLGIEEVAVVAISGGGPYAAAVMAAEPSRIRSVHLACAYADASTGERLGVDADTVAADPVAWWAMDPASPVHRIPGFTDSTVEEATRAFFARGRDVAPHGLRQALAVYDSEPLPDLSAVTAPAFLYWGERDRVVGHGHRRRWSRALPDVREERVYPEEGHDVQYRHWDQILCDVACLGDRVVLSDGRRTWLVPADSAHDLVGCGWTLGLNVWSLP